MKQRMSSGKARRDETNAAGAEGGYVSLPLRASEQGYTKSCIRCGGLLVNEWYYDLHNTGEHDVETLRCVQCGHRIDPVILQNQIRLPIESQVRPSYSAKSHVG
jgi:hypothetical protein